MTTEQIREAALMLRKPTHPLDMGLLVKRGAADRIAEMLEDYADLLARIESGEMREHLTILVYDNASEVALSLSKAGMVADKIIALFVGEQPSGPVVG